MRRWLPVPVLAAAALTLAACNSSSGAARTSTVFETVTGGSSAASQPATSGQASVTVVAPSGGSTTASASPSTTASAPTSTSKSTTSAPSTSTSPATKKVDPLKVDCSTLLTATDVNSALKFTLGGSAVKITDVADPTIGVTGKVRCRLGNTGGATYKVAVILTQYKDAAAAAAQIKVTTNSEVGNGAVQSSATVSGFPATILLRQGGLIVLQYSTWTMSIVVADKLANNATLTSGLPKLAQTALGRITG